MVAALRAFERPIRDLVADPEAVDSDIRLGGLT